MKVNYVLMYGTPYLRYREFETFEEMSKFLVNKSIVNYTIFEKMKDEKEVEMIYRDNDIRVLENRIAKAIELIDEPIYYATDKMETSKIFISRLKEVKELLQGEDNDI